MNPKALITLMLIILGAYTLVSCGLGFVTAQLIYATESPQ